MIVGIGHDICAIERIENMLQKRGDQFVSKHLSPNEQNALKDIATPKHAAHIAKRWAAKEAVAKALGTGIRDDIYLKDIEILNNEWGAPYVTLYNGALKQLEIMTPKEYDNTILISLSDDNNLASAFIVIETQKNQ